MTIATVKLFKTVELYADQKQLKLQSAQAKLLLAYCVEQQNSLSRSELATLFWPERSESEGLKLLRNLLNRIKTALPSLLEVNRYTVQFIKTDNQIDTLEVQELTKSTMVEDWQKAVLLYSGAFLEEVAQKQVPEGLVEWLELRRQFYQHTYVNNLHKLVHALSGTSNHLKPEIDFELAMFYTDAWQVVEPENERIYIHKLSLLAQQHKYDELENLYKQLKSQSLTKRIHKVIGEYYEALDIPKPQDRSIHIDQKTNVQAKDIIGREHDIKQVLSLLEEHRLISIIGIGGIGKTQITKAIVARPNPAFPDGIIFVSLPLTDASQLFSHLMRALGIYRSTQHDSKKEIIKSLYDKKLLLILDNAEHLTKELAPFLSELISQSLYLRCIVSSRIKLSIASEQVYPLGDLGVPQADASIDALKEMPAAQLLVREAQHNSSDLGFQEKYRETIIKLCQLSHGLPLAIEIIAANFSKVSIDEMVEQTLLLTKPLDNKSTIDSTPIAKFFSFGLTDASEPSTAITTMPHLKNSNGTLTNTVSSLKQQVSHKDIKDVDVVQALRTDERKDNSRRTAPRLRSKPRQSRLQHDSLKNCFEYSWSLLEEKQQIILAKQAVFFGGFDFQAFKEVTGATAYDLAVLINTSLIRRNPSGRYERHPLIYQFCREKLSAMPELLAEAEASHAAYFAGYALELQEYIDNYQSDIVLKIEPEVINFQRAIQYSVRFNKFKMIEPMVLALTSYLSTRGRYQEAVDICQTVLQYNSEENKNSIIEFLLLLWVVFFYSQAGNLQQAELYMDRIEQTLGLLMGNDETRQSMADYQEDVPFYLGMYEVTKGIYSDSQGLYVQAKMNFERTIELQSPFLQTHSNMTILLARNRLALQNLYLGNFKQARMLFEENLAHGDYFLQAMDTISLGELLLWQKDEMAEEKLLEGLELSTQKNMPLIQGYAHQYLGIVYTDKARTVQNQDVDYSEIAIKHLENALKLAGEMHEYRLISYVLSAGFAQLYMDSQQWSRAQDSLHRALELALECSSKARIIAAILRLATIDLQLKHVDKEQQRTAVSYLELIATHPASHFIDSEKAKAILEQSSNGELQSYMLNTELQKEYEDTRNMVLIHTVLEFLS